MSSEEEVMEQNSTKNMSIEESGDFHLKESMDSSNDSQLLKASISSDEIRNTSEENEIQKKVRFEKTLETPTTRRRGRPRKESDVNSPKDSSEGEVQKSVDEENTTTSPQSWCRIFVAKPSNKSKKASKVKGNEKRKKKRKTNH